MIADWRNHWGYDFPFYYAQIAPYIYAKNEPSYQLRDVQRLALKSTDNTGMAILMDIGKKIIFILRISKMLEKDCLY